MAQYIKREEVEQEVIPDTQTVVQNTPTDYRAKKAIFRTYQVIWYILGVVEVLLLLRFLLRMLGANPGSGFVSFIYGITYPLVLPFAGIFRAVGSSGFVIEWSVLVAMLVYALVAYGLVHLFQLVKPTDPVEVENSVDQQP